MAAPSNASLFGRSPSGITGSNPSAGMEVCLFVSVVCCQVEVSVLEPIPRLEE